MLHAIDWILIVVYLTAMVVVGIACRGRQENAEDYFTGGGGIGGVLGSVMVGLSIAATLFSGISFLAYPSVIYSTGLDLMVALAIFPLAWAVLVWWFLPRYLSSGDRHPYEIFERRFGPGVRTTAAAMFILLRIGWMAALIYAPTLAIMAAADLGPGWFWLLVLAIGLTSTLYTTLGGIRGVIVTDAIQFLVIFAGVALTIGYVLWYLPVPIATAWGELGDSGHLAWFDPTFDLTEPLTFWSVLIGAGVANMGSYLADQMSLQRYLALGSVKAASRSFAINVVGVMVVLVMLAGVGLALRSWYQHTHDPLLPESVDKIFPYFVATQLPVGLAGLVLAAILAATMSSMTSGINALAGTLTLDFRARTGLAMTAKDQLRFARWASLAIGMLSTLAAGLVSHLGSIFDIAQTLLGVFLGPLLAAMLLAMLHVRISGKAVMAGMVAGCLGGWVVAFTSIAAGWADVVPLVEHVPPIAALWVAPFAFGVALLVAAAAAGLIAAPPADAGESAVKGKLSVEGEFPDGG